MPHAQLTRDEIDREKKMLQELKRMKEYPLSTMSRKRVRVPKINLTDNPFCEDRQLADEKYLQKVNKVLTF